MEGIEQGDRVEIVGVWPQGVQGKVHHFTHAGDMAYIIFNKPQKSGEVWYEYNWYKRGELAKLDGEQPAQPANAEATGNDRKAFLHALFPAKYATLDDAMIASGADGVEFGL